MCGSHGLWPYTVLQSISDEICLVLVRVRKIVRWNRIEVPEIKTHTPMVVWSLIKELKSSSGEKQTNKQTKTNKKQTKKKTSAFSRYDVVSTGGQYVEECKLIYSFLPAQRLSSNGSRISA